MKCPRFQLEVLFNCTYIQLYALDFKENSTVFVDFKRFILYNVMVMYCPYGGYFYISNFVSRNTFVIFLFQIKYTYSFILPMTTKYQNQFQK